MKNLIIICCSVLLLMTFLQSNSFAQKLPKSKDVIVFEISKYSNPGGFKRTSTSELFIYQSGRIDCKSSFYDPRAR